MPRFLHRFSGQQSLGLHVSVGGMYGLRNLVLLEFRSCSFEDRALSSWVALAIAADSEVPVAEPSPERFRIQGLRLRV